MTYDFKQFSRRKLPHIHPPGAILFVTSRLAGSVPKPVLQEWKAEKEWLEHELLRVAREAKETDTIEALNHEARLIAFQRRWFLRFEEVLHRAEHGPTWLKDERIAKLVADSIRYRDSKVYRLDAYSIMSNHVQDEQEYHRVIAYVLNNPVKAGLVRDWREWPWSWRRTTGC